MYYIKITKICHIKYYTKIDRLNIITSQRFFNGLNKKSCGYAIRTSRVCGHDVLRKMILLFRILIMYIF